MQQQDNCVFCKIVRGEIPCIKVHEDELTLTFMDINPASAGHTLVVAKEHFENLMDIDATTLAAVAVTTQRIAQATKRALQPEGMRVNQFNGTAAGQTVFHYHVHIVPIRAGERPGSHGRGPGDPQEISKMAERIQAAVEN